MLYSFISNCHTFLNNRFASAKLDEMLRVGLCLLVFLLIILMYIFLLQPWPQIRQVIASVMGRWAGPLFCMVSQCDL